MIDEIEIRFNAGWKQWCAAFFLYLCVHNIINIIKNMLCDDFTGTQTLDFFFFYDVNVCCQKKKLSLDHF